MLQDSKIWSKYQKWAEGISKIDARIHTLEEEKRSINDQINDNIEETPEEMVELHTRLHQIDREIESARAIKAEFKTKKPFTQEEFFDGYREDIKDLAIVLEDSSERLKQARAELREALSEYLKVYTPYNNDYVRNQSGWENVFREVGYDPTRLTSLRYSIEPDLTDRYAKEVSIGIVIRGEQSRVREVFEEE